jgi:hypothetical protein
MPILGIMASSTPSVGDYESISTVTVGGAGSATITFSSIPSTYKHLQIRMTSRGTTSSGFGIDIRFNNDSGGNYSPSHYLEGTGSAAISGAAISGTPTLIEIYGQPPSATTASVFGGSIIDVLDYANTNKYKTLRHLGGFDANGSGLIDLDSGLWLSTSAINRIDITCVATAFAQYSSFALYGIRG